MSKSHIPKNEQNANVKTAAGPDAASKDDDVERPLLHAGWMYVISVVVMLLAGGVGVWVVNSIPAVSELPDGDLTPIQYVLRETTSRLALPVALLLFAAAFFNLCSVISPVLKKWFDYYAKMTTLCAVFYTTVVVVMTAFFQ